MLTMLITTGSQMSALIHHNSVFSCLASQLLVARNHYNQGKWLPLTTHVALHWATVPSLWPVHVFGTLCLMRSDVIRRCSSPDSFKCSLKTHLYIQCYF